MQLVKLNNKQQETGKTEDVPRTTPISGGWTLHGEKVLEDEVSEVEQ